MTKLFSNQRGVVWDFKVTGNMLGDMDDVKANLFFNTLEDSIEKICSEYNVEPWEMKE